MICSSYFDAPQSLAQTSQPEVASKWSAAVASLVSNIVTLEFYNNNRSRRLHRGIPTCLGTLVGTCVPRWSDGDLVTLSSSVDYQLMTTTSCLCLASLPPNLQQ